MANELLLNASLWYSKNNTVVTENVVNLLATVGGDGLNNLSSYTAPTADTLLPLGSITIPGGWLFIINTDVTNYVTVKAAVAGQNIAKLKPGYFTVIPLDPTITAPSTQSNTAPCVVKYAVFDL